MKHILFIANTFDLQYGIGNTPAAYQLAKALHEIGHEVTTIPYLGRPVQTPYWRALPNPLTAISLVYKKYQDMTSSMSVSKGNVRGNFSYALIKSFVTPTWYRYLNDVLSKYNFDFVFIYQVPVNHLVGIASMIEKDFQIPVVYWDGDMPSSLPDYADGKSFRFSMYPGADLSEYSLFLTNSLGCVQKLQDKGARRTNVLYYAADPTIFSPVNLHKYIDVFYYGHRNIGKENQFDYMITGPSQEKANMKFYVGGADSVKVNKYEFSGVEIIGKLPLNVWRTWCSNSHINLNITKDTDSAVYASSSARPFELAAMGCCIVSDKYEGLNVWFDTGEVIVVQNKEEAISNYEYLLKHPTHMTNMGHRARHKLTMEHTYKHRAEKLIRMVNEL